MLADFGLTDAQMLHLQALLARHADLAFAAHRRGVAQGMLGHVVVLLDLGDPAARGLAVRFGRKPTEVRRKMAIARENGCEPALAFPAPIDTARAILAEVVPGTAEGLDDWQPGETFHIVVASAGGACIATASGQVELN